MKTSIGTIKRKVIAIIILFTGCVFLLGFMAGFLTYNRITQSDIHVTKTRLDKLQKEIDGTLTQCVNQLKICQKGK